MPTAENTKAAFPRYIDKSRRFFEFDADLRGGGKGHGVRIANEDQLKPKEYLMFSRPPEGGFSYMTEKPLLVHNRKEGKMPRDIEPYGSYFLVSERLKRIFDEVDSAGFEFVECDFILGDGSKGPQYYLADVIRVQDAVDESASKIRIDYERDYRTNEDVKIYDFVGPTSLVFRDEVVADAHIFRTPYADNVFCDEVLKSACKVVSGTRFRDVERM